MLKLKKELLLSNNWQVHKNVITDKWQILDEHYFCGAGGHSLTYSLSSAAQPQERKKMGLGPGAFPGQEIKSPQSLSPCVENSFLVSGSTSRLWSLLNPCVLCGTWLTPVRYVASAHRSIAPCWPQRERPSGHPSGVITCHWSWFCSVFSVVFFYPVLDCVIFLDDFDTKMQLPQGLDSSLGIVNWCTALCFTLSLRQRPSENG